MVTATASAVPPAVVLLGSVAEKCVQVFGWNKSLLLGQAQPSCWYCCSLQRCLSIFTVLTSIFTADGSLDVAFLPCSGFIALIWAERRESGPSAIFTRLPCAGFRETVPAVPFLILSEQCSLCSGSLVFCEAPHTCRACWHFFKMACIYLMKSYVNLDANSFQPSGCLASCLVCSRCWKSLRTTVAPRETFKRVIPLLFFLIKVIVPRPSLNYLPSSERKGYFSLSFPLGNSGRVAITAQ